MDEDDKNEGGKEQPEIEGEDKKLLVLPLGRESKKLTQVISNETAMKILELLAEAPLSTSQISEMISLPITTVQYNIDNLMNSGLIRIDKVKYSEKGREVKIYAPRKKLIVLVPEKTDSGDVLGILKKYVALVFFAVVSAGVVELLTQRVPSYVSNVPLREGAMKGLPEAANATIPLKSFSDAANATGNATVPMAPVQEGIVNATTGGLGASNVSDIWGHFGVWFLLGCLAIILILACYEFISKRKR